MPRGPKDGSRVRSSPSTTPYRQNHLDPSEALKRGRGIVLAFRRTVLLAIALSSEENNCDPDERDGHHRTPANFFAGNSTIHMNDVTQGGCGDHRSDQNPENIPESLIK